MVAMVTKCKHSDTQYRSEYFDVILEINCGITELIRNFHLGKSSDRAVFR